MFVSSRSFISFNILSAKPNYLQEKDFAMSTLKISIAILCLSLLALAIEADPSYLACSCSNTTTFIQNSTYNHNLNLLLSSLASNATGNNGFYNTTVGQASDTVYGLFLCRGDLTDQVCQECLNFATQFVLVQCPVQKVAIIWYDECFLRYSNQSIFSTVTETPTLQMCNSDNVIEQNIFNQLVGATMNDTATLAASNPPGTKKLATNEAKFTLEQTVYALVQCTPDLSEANCRGCLAIAIWNLSRVCRGRRGGRFLLPSCDVRYETYRFYNESAVMASPPASVPALPPSPSRTKGKRQPSWKRIVTIVAAIVALVVLFLVGYWLLCRRGKKKYQNAGNDIPTIESLQFDLGTIKSATRKFSDDNKLGQGGFGVVYKGTLHSGQDIAVKRLSRSSGQGAKEFKNEVVVVAKLQHRNLVRLLGFCLEGKEKILVYEFVSNKSLDFFLYDPEKQGHLDWLKRYNIIEGIARGILYLHHDSRLRIIHRDLKPSNILLDGDMKPKISDFGMARIFGVDQTQGITNRIVGTYGYMPPEYAMHGQFSIKSDVYSFGVLVLEIIAGKKNSSFYHIDVIENLPSHAWKLWRAETPLEMLDPTLRDSYSRDEVIRCIHLGLLCVQEDPTVRPTMVDLVSMLHNYSLSLPSPQQPAFFLHGRTEHNSSQSTTKSLPSSDNEASITQLQPR
ncbi:cysteine-rich receptor-like protein kinase 10 [Tripterygium wilfordii]|uniref:cysteine-rich receptor-like protein kinase 10 n=1 Tax=Tripterygium wilfordii TaxID=458696 RepID=UPI0018F81418|nr:cysteine-rich receptor-like protein kinase 10 [Tripterygium wilfordii]